MVFVHRAALMKKRITNLSFFYSVYDFRGTYCVLVMLMRRNPVNLWLVDFLSLYMSILNICPIKTAYQMNFACLFVRVLQSIKLMHPCPVVNLNAGTFFSSLLLCFPCSNSRVYLIVQRYTDEQSAWMNYRGMLNRASCNSIWILLSMQNCKRSCETWVAVHS